MRKWAIMTKFLVKKDYANKIRSGYRLLEEDDLLAGQSIRQVEEGCRIDLVDADRNFIARALIGRQNKGLGWIFSLDPALDFNQDFVWQQLKQAEDKRYDFIDYSQTNAFRLFNGEGDGIGGITIDNYKGYLQINWYSKGIYGYRDWFIDYLSQSDQAYRAIYETIRFDLDSDQEQIKLVWGQAAPQPLIIKENGINFAIYLGQEWMTGLFLDQRQVRDYLLTQAYSGSLLNLFSYTGGFSVVAAKAGVQRTVSVDVANRSLDKTKEQFQINNINLAESDHEIRVMDVFDYLNYAKRHQLQFDWVVCDPPSYAQTKKYIFSAEKDYKSLASDLFTLTKPGGMTLISTNHAGYPLDKFIKDMVEVGLNHPGKMQLIQRFSLGQDYPTTADPQSQYLKVLIFYRTC